MEEGLKNALSEAVINRQTPFGSAPPDPSRCIRDSRLTGAPWSDDRRSLSSQSEYERLAKYYQVLKRVNAAIISIADGRSLFSQLSEIFAESHLFSMASISVINTMTGELVSAFTCCERPFQKGLANELFDRVFARHCAGAAKASRILNDLELDVFSPSWRALALGAGLRSFASLPIAFNGEFKGTVTVFSDAAEHFDPGIVDLLYRIAETVAYALHAFEESVERRAYERGLSESRRELKELLLHLHSAREDERNLVARELYDELGQTLNSLKLDLSVLGNAQSTNVAHQEKRLARMTEAIDHGLEEVHRIVSALCPRILSDLGLGPAIEWLVSEFSGQSGIQCRLQLDLPRDNDIPHATATTAFRCVQEYLTIIGQASTATSVSLMISIDHALLKLSISDNGSIDNCHAGPTATSFGTISIRQRIELLGGSMTRINRFGHGTCIEITLPITEQAE